MEAKAVNDAVAFIRSLAELRGRNAGWAEKAVREAASLSATAALRAHVHYRAHIYMLAAGKVRTFDCLILRISPKLAHSQPMKEPVRRRSQAERKLTLRQSVLTAAVSTLHAYGYGATTTVMVAEAAGISRGAMQNHFPTKADLMVFVVEEVYAQEIEEYRRLLAGIEEPEERSLGYIDAAWSLLSRPSGVAVLEILMGSRSDAVLADKLKSSLANIENSTLLTLERELHRCVSPDQLRLIVWAVRGLSIENVLSGGHGAEASVKLLRRVMQAALKAGVLP